MKLHTKLLLGFGSLWLVFLLATIAAVYALQQQGGSLKRLFESCFVSVVYCDQMKTSLDEINRMTLSTVWTHELPPSEAAEKVWKEFESEQNVQAGNITLPGERELTVRFFDLSRLYKNAVTKFTSSGEAARADIYQQDLLPRYLSARSGAQDIIDLNRKNLVELESRLQDNADEVRHIQTAFVVMGAGLAGICVLILTKTILGPLRSLTDSARQIEAGNLDLTVPVRSGDELGELAHAFNAMAAKLREYRQLDHARLLHTQQITQLAIDSLPDAVAVFNPDGVVEISNHQARTHFGLEPGSLQSNSRLDWLSPLFTDSLVNGHTVEPIGYQSAVQLFDQGEERFLLPRAVPMFGEKRNVIGIVVILVDVTGLHRVAELKSGLVATVSHELKTPLAATRFSVHLLAQETVSPLNDRQRLLIKAACDGADRLDRIIENLLQFQRIDEGQYRIREVPMAPGVIVKQVVEPLNSDFANAGLELQADIPSDLPEVLVDPDLISYVFGNLLSNALKFVPRGGKVFVSAVHRADGVYFTVGDNGPGIAEEHFPKIFDRFYRAGASRKIPGAGLGLAIARQLVEAHGGQIFVSSRASGGVEFTFFLKISSSAG